MGVAKRHRPYGPIFQNAYIVEDLDDAINDWASRMNTGPFCKFPESRPIQAEYRGRPQSIAYQAAIGYTGDLQIELIKPLGSNPSIYREWLDAGRVDVQHHCVLTDNMDAARADLEQRGATQAQWARLHDGSEVAYFDLGDARRPMLEVALLSSRITAIFARVKDAARNWDGQNTTFDLL